MIVNLWAWVQRFMFAMLIAVVSWYAATVNSLQEGRIRSTDQIDAIQGQLAEFKTSVNSRLSSHDAMDQKEVDLINGLSNDVNTLKNKSEYNYSQVGILRSLAEKVPDIDTHVGLLNHQMSEVLSFKTEVEQTGSPILRAAIEDLSETKKQLDYVENEVKQVRLQIEEMKSQIKTLGGVVNSMVYPRNLVPPGIRPN